MIEFINKNILIKLLLHIVIVVSSYTILFNLNIFKVNPDNTNLLNWDAAFHYSIMADGYQYIAFAGCNLAFFPLFPLIWKITAMSPVWISILNILIFISSLIWLMQKEKLSNAATFLIISIPSFIFFALPYSEAIFFLFATFVIIGYRSNNPLLRNIGFFGASIAKSVSVILIPAIIICEFLISSQQKSTEQVGRNIVSSSIFSFAGLLIAAAIQGVQTGKWFYFLEMQQYWGRHWIIPEIPLHTPVAYDGIAFILGSIAIYLCIKQFYHINFAIYFGISIPMPLNRAVIFSMLYLSATTILDTFFTYNNSGANIWSLNRHFFCTPFALIFIIWLISEFKPSKTDHIVITTLLLSGIFLTGMYQNPQMILNYILYLGSIMVLKFRQDYAKFIIVIYLLNCFTQLQYYHDFLSGIWIG